MIFLFYLFLSEDISRRSVKKVSLEISLYSQENTCVADSPETLF